MPLVAALVGGAAISFSAIMYRLADASPVTGAFFRAFYALPFLVVLWWSSRRRDARSRRERALALLAGALLGADLVTWHMSINHIGAGLATLLANSQVVFVALLAWAIFGERPSRVVAWAVPTILAGVALVSGLGRADAFGEEPVLGTALAMVAAVFYAGFILGYRRSNRSRAPAVGSLLDATLGAALTTLAAGAIWGGLHLAPEWPSHGWLAALAVSTQVLGWLAIGYALPRLPAAETSTMILVQPALTMLWGALIFAERPSPLQLGGAVLVLAGVAAVAWSSASRLTAPSPG